MSGPDNKKLAAGHYWTPARLVLGLLMIVVFGGTVIYLTRDEWHTILASRMQDPQRFAGQTQGPLDRPRQDPPTSAGRRQRPSRLIQHDESCAA